LILFFILPFASAQEIPDYDKPYAPIFFDKPIYSWTDKIEIKIIAPSWNTDKDLIDSIGNDEENPIKISTREYSLEQYRLTETDVRSGIFTGEIISLDFYMMLMVMVILIQILELLELDLLVDS